MSGMRLRGSLITLAGLVVLATTSLVLFSSPLRVYTQDRNGDGRPDRWQYYDAHGNLLRENIDTNFDGRSDVQESYQDGRLVRRESDRNFDDQIDLTDEFDPKSGQHTRAVVDVDFDGRADLLVLFSDGAPVFSEWARSASRPETAADLLAAQDGRRSDESLRPFDDPFSSAQQLRSDVPRARVVATCADPRAIPAAFGDVSTAPHIVGVSARRPSSYVRIPRAPSIPRGPPVASIHL